MPVFIAKYNEQMGASGEFGAEPTELIGTIKVPRNLSLLHDRLPASQYEEAAAQGKRNSPGSLASQLKPMKQQSSSKRSGAGDDPLMPIAEENDFKPAVGPGRNIQSGVKRSQQLGMVRVPSGQVKQPVVEQRLRSREANGSQMR